MLLACLVLLGFVLRMIIGLKGSFCGLTVGSSWRWAVSACFVAMTAVGMRLISSVPPGMTSGVHYLAATLLLAPMVDILGARNPGHRTWPWFVVVPLIAVLQWPTVSHLFSERLETAVVIPLPATIGFLLVLAMGSGNYFGTANTTACLIGSMAIVLFVLPVTELVAWPGDAFCLASCICLTIAALLIEGRLKAMNASADHQSLWADFRDIYGMVWARRVMDRINQFAEREKWSVVMTLDGFRPRDEADAPNGSLERPQEILKWVLRRFADGSFFDRYLSLTTETESQEQHSST